MGAAPPAPLMTLRDLLELACESSCSEGFRSYPRRLAFRDDAVLEQAKKAEAEAAPAHLLVEADLRRSPSRTLSSILFPRSPGSLATVSRLTRSLSRRLVFWRRHRGDADADERDSLGLPSPVVSSCSASQCSEHPESVADLPVPEEHKDESEKPSTSTSSGCTASADDGAAGRDGHKAMEGDPVESMEEKQQLSPVSVMDFPFHDEDERSDAGTCSTSCFQQHRQRDLERSDSAQELLLLHKVRRLDGLAQAGVDVDPVDLEPRFDASDDQSGTSVSDDTQAPSDSSTSTETDHDDSAATMTTSTALSPDGQHRSGDDAEREADEHRRRRLLARVLKGDDGTADSSAVAAERLLLDFFAEGLDRRRSLPAGPVVGTVKMSDHGHDESALVRAAKQWVQGAGTQWGVEDVLFTGEAALADMDRERRWMCVGDEKQEVGVAVGELLTDVLVAELVLDLAARC